MKIRFSFAMLTLARGALVVFFIFHSFAFAATPPSDPLDFWEWRHPLPQGNDLAAITYGAGQFVSVGDYATIVETPDGENFTLHSLEKQRYLRIVAYGNGRFVAVGNSAESPFPMVSLISTNGTDWLEQPVDALANRSLNSLAFGNGVFVLVGNAETSTLGRGAIFTSPDGVTWTDRSADTPYYLFDVLFANDLFVAVGRHPSAAPAILTSPDGITWTLRDAGAPASLFQVAYGNGTFVVLGLEEFPKGVALTSNDGITWKRSVFQSHISLPMDLAFGNGQFVFIGDGDFATIFMTSADGVTWTVQGQSQATDLDFRALTFADGRFVAAGGQGNFAVSTDGTNWTIASSATHDNLRGVTYADGRFVTVGNLGINAVSTDGTIWDWHARASTQNLHHVTFGNGAFVAVGAAGTALRSTDTVSWTPQISDTSEDLFDVTYHNGMFVAVGGHFSGVSDNIVFYHSIVTSSDGVTWKQALGGTGFRLHGVTFGDGIFVAVGQPGVVLTSTNAIDWEKHPAGVQYLKSVAYGNGIYVSVGEQGGAGIASSTNGTTWTITAAAVSPGQFDEVIFADGHFVATGDNGLIITSSDGISWNERHSPTATNLRGIAFGKGAFTIVGNNEVILQSALSGPPLLGVTGKNPAGFQLGLRGELGRHYQLQSSVNLLDWSTISSFTASSPTTNFLDPANSSHRFYRLISP
jgi:hypothetical protein